MQSHTPGFGFAHLVKISSLALAFFCKQGTAWIIERCRTLLGGLATSSCICNCKDRRSQVAAVIKWHRYGSVHHRHKEWSSATRTNHSHGLWLHSHCQPSGKNCNTDWHAASWEMHSKRLTGVLSCFERRPIYLGNGGRSSTQTHSPILPHILSSSLVCLLHSPDT